LFLVDPLHSAVSGKNHETDQISEYASTPAPVGEIWKVSAIKHLQRDTSSSSNRLNDHLILQRPSLIAFTAVIGAVQYSYQALKSEAGEAITSRRCTVRTQTPAATLETALNVLCHPANSFTVPLPHDNATHKYLNWSYPLKWDLSFSCRLV